MNLYIKGNNYHYAIEQLLRVFLPDVHLQKIYEYSHFEGDFIACESEQFKDVLHLRIVMGLDEEVKEQSLSIQGGNLYKAGELNACRMIYLYLKNKFHYTPEWGMQTGVRPTKIYFNLLRNNSADEAIHYLEDELFISPQKARLVQTVCENEKDIMDSAGKGEFSLYVSIPFCPSRCAYCSFISHAFNAIKKLIPEYVNCLCREIALVSQITKHLNLKLRTVYIGGGTPTVLSSEQLKKIFDTIADSFDLSAMSECTLEAGRPDSLNEEKLMTVRDSFVTRITINAQSFNDEVLQIIGRKHTAEDVVNAYQLARKLGFHNINTDLIAGLEGESIDSFVSSVEKAVELGAENITIHTLALKRSSFLITRDEKKGQIVSDTSKMIDLANAILLQNGYHPYYMYRQSKSVGNLENTGWAKAGKNCEYNVFMMEEVQNVIGVGAGAVSRLINADHSDIKRVFNFKYPFEYIQDFEKIIQRKEEMQTMLELLQNS